jgi:Flp pilus assembly protein TadG
MNRYVIVLIQVIVNETMKDKEQHDIRGSAVIEFVIVLPLLCLVLFAIIEYGIIFYDKNIITNASREGARYGIVSQNSAYPTSANITSYITSHFTTHLVTFASSNPTPTITVSSTASPPTTGAQLTVTVTYSYTCLVLNKLAGFTSPMNITSTTVMIYE